MGGGWSGGLSEVGAIIAGFAGGEGRFREVRGLAAGAAWGAVLDVAACG